MTTDLAPARPATIPDVRIESHRGIELAIARRALRQIVIGAGVCAVVFGGTVASSALSYVSTFPTAASRAQLLVTMGHDSGLSMLLGPLSEVDTVGGYTFYKSSVSMLSAGAIWAVLVATRLFRGEEEAGRWAILRAGATRASRAAAATLVALAAAVVVVGAGTAALTALAGRDPDVAIGLGASALLGVSIVVTLAVFAAVGACTSQLCRTRRLASGIGLGVVGVCFALRMVGDAGADEHWVLWLTPLGWPELMRPLTGGDLWPLLPGVISIGVLATAAIVLASRRDIGDGILATSDVSPVRPFGLGSAFGMTARLELPVLASWAIGAAVAGFLLGLVAKITLSPIPSSMTGMLDKFGVAGTFTTQYLGIAFLMTATVVALLPAGQVGAACDEETSGRLNHLLTRPVRRSTWYAGRLLLTAVAVVVAAMCVGLSTWLGARSQGVEVGLGSMVGAGLNLVPTAFLTLGFGAVVLSIAPRAAALSVYVLVGWSFVVDLLSSMVTSLSWLDRVSLFRYFALAPAESVDAVTVVVSLVVAVALAGIATALFARRDLQRV